MTLSIVIVNYNVKHFLQQCLRSVQAAAEGIETEIWVVDNNSVDGSVQMVRSLFPDVHLIANADNPGFATANNQALRQCTGDYLLLLNPDTLVQRDTFTSCLQFYADHPDCGGLSVKMVNGEGVFLKESKRGFPSPATSFFKISGLIKLFPRNRHVGAYYMGHLDDNQVNEVDILPGAFLMISRQALQQTGLLDESYFMYGEDVDFSWRIKLAGFKNYYLPTTRILHYKGESTRKSSMNYVYTFYNAMAIFARKYFSRSGANTYTLLIQLAIWLRASVDFAKRIVSRLALPLADFAASFAGFLLIKQVWASYWAENVNYYPSFYTWSILPLYVLILLLASWLAGGYDKPLRIGRIVQGISFGALCLLVFYSLLDEGLRFSRAIVLLGSIWSILAVVAIRLLLSLLHVDGFRLRPDRGKRYLVVAHQEEYDRVCALFDSLGIVSQSVARLDPHRVGSLSESATLRDDSHRHAVDEIIFCSKDVDIATIIDSTELLKGKGIDFRIAPEGMDVLIGSNYTSSTDELYTPDFGNVSTPTNRRTKRLFDLVSALLLLLLSPVLFWFQQRRWRFFADCFHVLLGHRSWVGYSRQPQPNKVQLPDDEPLPWLRRGILRTSDILPHVKNPDLARLDTSYAYDYRLMTDVTILLRNLNRL